MLSTTKKALVTGVSSGIGKEIAKTFIKNNIEVIGTYNSRIPDIAEFGEGAQGKITFKKLNLCNTDEIISFVKDIHDIDILVNNAGLGSKTVEKMSKNKYEQDEMMLKVNTLAPLWLIQELLPKLEKQRIAKIINISSVGGGIFHFPGFRISDGMSKASLTFATKQLAAELVHSTVDIFAVCPGATQTDMFEQSTLKNMTNEQRVSFEKSLPKSRMIRPEEIANICLFLSQDESTVLHGAVLDSSMGLGVHPGLITGNK